MGISTLKLKITCPKCKKDYLLSDVEAMFVTRSSSGWRFDKLPNNLRCEDCGTIDPETVSCDFPIWAITQRSFKNVFILLIPALIILGLIYIIAAYFLR